MPSVFTKSVLIAANVVVASSLFLATGGCENSLVFAKDARNEGMSLYNSGFYSDAEASFASAARQDPRDYRSYYYMGACFEQMHDYQQAISCYKSSLDVMAVTLIGKNDTQFRYRALDSLATAISRSEGHAAETVALEHKTNGKAQLEDQWLLAKVYRYTGDADAAIDAYNKAVLIDPKNFAVAKEAGLYEEKLGQKPRAAFALRQAFAINPDDQQVNQALARLGVPGKIELQDSHDLAQSAVFVGPGQAGEAAMTQTPRD